MPQPLAQLTLELRTLANDTPTSNPIYRETPDGTVDGVNVNFRLQNTNLVNGQIFITQGTSFRQTPTALSVTVDYTNGILTWASAPTVGTSPFEVDYYFNWFPDSDYSTFLTVATRDLGPGDVNDPTQVPEGLIGALYQFGLAHFHRRRAAAYANKFSSGGGQATEQVEVVTKAFKSLADSAYATAVKMRADYYNRQGQKQSPASGTTTYGVDPYTPRR